jgi:hypothetical protein
MRARFTSAAVALILFLSACSGNPSLPESTGQISYTDGTARITVPALWAGADPDGNPVGGVEPAEIVVSTAGITPEYGVDLADIEAQGAGNAWRAATSMASAFATVYTSVDPTTVDLNFTVTGPIDGPSAGGILTVGLIAAFQGQSLQPGMTMTGTITADGSIGPVGGVLTKIESAAREGFSSVVLPVSLAPGTWEQGNEFTERAAAVGVSIIPVHTIGEAYAAMTGSPIGPPDLSAGPPLSANTQGVTETLTEQTTQLLEQRLREDTSIEPNLQAWAQQLLTQATQDQANGDVARAYGNAVLALTEITRDQAARDTEDLIRSKGLESTREFVRKRAQEVRTQAQAALTAASTTQVQGLSQCFALPTALGWASFALITMDGISKEIGPASDAPLIIDFAQSIAEGELGIDLFLPQALDVVTSLEQGSGEDCSTIAPHLSGYSRFLVQAAQASTGYLADVLGSELDADDTGLKQDYTAGALAAENLAQGVTAAVDPYPAEVEQFTTALTYFWLTSYAVSAKQAYEVMPGATPGDFAAMRQESMDIAVDQTWWFTKYRAEILTQQGFDTGAAIWSARWALEESLANRAGPYATDADWLALGELWYDAVQMTTMLSYLEPATISESSVGQ